MSEAALFSRRVINPPADIPIEEMTENQCLDMLGHIEKQRARSEAVKARVLARFAALRRPNRPGVELMDGAPEEIAIELGMSPNTAAVQLLQADTLVRRLPATLTALQDGDIDYMRMKALVDGTRDLTDHHARRVEEKVLARGRMASYGRFRAGVRREAIKADPETAAAREQAARATRDVRLRNLDDGMASLNVTLRAHEAQLAFAQIDRLAREVRTPQRSLAQCRADVLMDMVLGKDCRRARVTVNVMMPLSTLMGLNRHPGELSGYGPITAEYARELAQHATWQRVLTDPPGHVLETSGKRFASPRLRRFLHARDRICRQPGCNRPAQNTEVDHTIPHATGGQTGPDNNHLRCQRHNLMKQRNTDWRIHQHPKVFWSSPPLPGGCTSPHPSPTISHPSDSDLGQGLFVSAGHVVLLVTLECGFQPGVRFPALVTLLWCRLLK